MLLLALLLASCRLPRPAFADAPAVSGAAVQTQEDQEVQELAKTLQENPGARAALTQRILDSSLSSSISKSDDDAVTAQEADKWILAHPIDAAHLAYGFAQDDASGTHTFEKSLSLRIERLFVLNPKRYKGILGRLDAAGTESKKISLSLNIPEEEQRETLKRLFEGQGAESSKVLPGSEGDKSSRSAVSSGPSTFAGSGIYDRLSAANPTGYSPFVQAYQSQLNQQVAPGAPHIIETGRLDAPTLIHPFYELRYQIDRLNADWVYQKAWALSRALGMEGQLSQEKLKDPRTLAALEQRTAGKPLASRFDSRRKALDAAVEASNSFRDLAAQVSNRSQITHSFLKKLGAKQKDAARWITAASLEEDLQRLEGFQGFWTAELRDRVQACPVDAPTRKAYLDQGDKLDQRLKQAIDLETRAISVLEGSGYIDHWDELDRQVTDAKRLRSGLDSDITTLATVPPRLLAAYQPEPWWRSFAEQWIVRLAPSSDWAARIRRKQEASARLQDAFSKIAAGDFGGARQAAQEVGTIGQ